MLARSSALFPAIVFSFAAYTQYTTAQRAEHSIIDLRAGSVARAHGVADTRGTTPYNDLCDNSVVNPLGVGQSVTMNGDNTGATDTEGFGHANVWESFELTDCASITVSYCGTSPAFSLVYSILTTVGCPGFVAIQRTDTSSCGDGNVEIFFADLPAGVYHIPVLLEPGVSEGPYMLTITAAACDLPPANDRCINAITVPVVQDCSQGGTVYGNNSTAAQQGVGPVCDSTLTQFQDVWYQFNSGMDTMVTFNLGTGTTGDLGIEVLDGCGGLSLFCDRGDTVYHMQVDTSTLYKVRIFSNTDYGQGGNFTFCVSAATAPVCDGGMVSADVGDSAVVVCFGTGPAPIGFHNTSSSIQPYSYVVATESDTIIMVLASDNDDFSTYPLGVYHVWGFSHSGPLLGADPGSPVSGIVSSGGCWNLSANTFVVDVEICQGLNASEENAWSLMQDPASNEWLIVNGAHTMDASIEVLDMAGRMLVSDRLLLLPGQMHRLSTAVIRAAGVYAVRLTSNSGSVTRRVLVR